MLNDAGARGRIYGEAYVQPEGGCEWTEKGKRVGEVGSGAVNTATKMQIVGREVEKRQDSK